MKEHPILFSGPMVRAILEGRKTMTRRTRGLEQINSRPNAFSYQGQNPDGNYLFCDQDAITAGHDPQTCLTIVPARYYPGDRLWVREAWKAHTTFDHLPPRDIPHSHVWYMADDGYKAESRYRQGMFMPRWASRITLEITAVRVEKLQDISADDARAEGCPDKPFDGAEQASVDLLAKL